MVILNLNNYSKPKRHEKERGMKPMKKIERSQGK